MIFRRRPSQSDGDTAGSVLTIVRDVVEIVAILAAGVWAFYTFVYENQIKPAHEKAEVQVESTLTKLGEQNGLIAVRSRVTIANVGRTEIWLYGFAETVTGTKIRARAKDVPASSDSNPTKREDEPGWTASGAAPVYDFAVLTKIADSRSTNGFNLRQGQSFPFDRVFFVRADRFDELATHISLRFAADAAYVPFHLHLGEGVLHVERSGPGPVSIDDIDEYNGTLSLWR